MAHHRGVHNLMQRRAQYRCPGRPPRVRVPPPVRACRRLPLKPDPVPYEPRHRRAAEDAKLMLLLEELCGKLERINRETRRAVAALDRWVDVERLYADARETWRREHTHNTGSTTTATVEGSWPRYTVTYSSQNSNGPTTATGQWW